MALIHSMSISMLKERRTFNLQLCCSSLFVHLCGAVLMHRRAGVSDCTDEEDEEEEENVIDSDARQSTTTSTTATRRGEDSSSSGDDAGGAAGLAARQREAAARWASEIINNQTLPHLFTIGRFNFIF